MTAKKSLVVVFVLMVLAQLLAPLKMIFDKEKILAEGKLFKFRTAPIDPNDPFRGKYITLNYAASSFVVDSAEDWNTSQTAFVVMDADEKGFVSIRNVLKEYPGDEYDCVQAKVAYVTMKKDSQTVQQELNLEYPFERFYMEETKAPLAESMFWEMARDTTKTTYALVSIRQGKAVIKDVFIGESSLRSLVEQSKLK